MTEQPPTLRITVVGEGPDAGRRARALRACDGLAVTQITGASEEELLADLSRPDVHAMAFVTPAPDLQGSIKRALMARRHVLICGPVALSARQLGAIDAFARARRLIVSIDTGIEGDDRFAFARKMVSGGQALWRPRYVRSLRTGESRWSLDELAIADVYMVLSLLRGVPSRVSAVAPRVDDETGAADVAMATLMFDAGPVARIDVSLVEPEPRHETTIACDSRTIVLDDDNPRAPLQILASGRHRGPQRGRWAETISEHPVSEPEDRQARTAEAFVAAVRSEDAAATNATGIATAAMVWELARESMARGGEMLSIARGEGDRPVLQLIHGAGRGGSAQRAPELTLVARESYEDQAPLSSA